MAQLGTTFDANTVDPSKPFELFPVGEYIGQIIFSENRANKQGGGQHLYLEFEIIEGEYTGRKWWERLNLWNDNETTVKIAQETLSALCYATGVMTVDDSELFHFKPMIIKMRQAPRKDTKEPENRAHYLPLPGTPQAAALEAKRPAPRQPQASAGPGRQQPPRQAPPQVTRQQPPAAQPQPQQQPQQQQAAPAAADAGQRPWQRHRT